MDFYFKTVGHKNIPKSLCSKESTTCLKDGVIHTFLELSSYL